MKTIWIITISTMVSIGFFGGGTYYFSYAKATKEKNELNKQIIYLSDKLDGAKASLADVQAQADAKSAALIASENNNPKTQTSTSKKAPSTQLQTNTNTSTNGTTTPVDETANWETYTNSLYHFSFKHPADFSVAEDPQGWDEMTGTNSQLITLGKDSYISIYNVKDELTALGLASNMEGPASYDFTIGSQPAKKYIADITQYVVFSPNNNRIILDVLEPTSENVNLIEKILLTLKFTS